MITPKNPMKTSPPNTRYKGAKVPCTFLRKRYNPKQNKPKIDEIANILVPDGTSLEQV